MRLRTNIWIARGIVAVKLVFLLGLLLPAFRAGAAGLLAWLVVALVLSAEQISQLTHSVNLSCPLCGRSYGPGILLRMRCPRCGQDIPEDARVSPLMWIPTILLGVLVIGALIYTRPLPFPTLPTSSPPITVLYSAPWPVDEELSLRIPGETYDILLPSGSSQAEAVQEVLDRYTYRRSWDTLTGSTSIHFGVLDDTLSISYGGHALRLFCGRNLAIDGRVYRIVGWSGDQTGTQLVRELMAVLQLPPDDDF